MEELERKVIIRIFNDAYFTLKQFLNLADISLIDARFGELLSDLGIDIEDNN